MPDFDDNQDVPDGQNRNFLYLAVMFGFLSLLIGVFMLSGSVQEKQKFTEFYVLDKEKQAKFDSFRPDPGQTIEIYIGIANHEGEAVNYRVLVKSGNDLIQSYGPVSVADGQTYEEKVEFAWPDSADNAVDIILNRENALSPYRMLHLKGR